jgi:hypothetical protein
MVKNVKNEIAALGRMTAAELRRQHAGLFGEPARSGNWQWLFRRCAWRVQALAEGDLSERARKRAAELARDADIRVRPPRETPPPATVTGPAATAAFRIPRDARLPMPGAVIRRIFKGHEYLVMVLPDGFEYDGQVYKSLSAVVHAITGCHWNGYHFFGMAGGKAV